MCSNSLLEAPAADLGQFKRVKRAQLCCFNLKAVISSNSNEKSAHMCIMRKKLNVACTTTTASVNVITFNWRQRTSFITPNACEPTNAAICDNQA